MATEFENRLKAARKYAKLTQAELEKLTGIRQSTLSTAERGGNGSTETALIARACKVDACWLTNGKGKMELGDYQDVGKTSVTSLPIQSISQAIELLGKALLANPDWGTEKLTGTVSDWVKDPANERKKKSLLDLFSEQDHTGSANESKAA